jgi:hypothetical protein
MTYNPNITCDDCKDVIPMCETHEQVPLHLNLSINDLVPNDNDKGLSFRHRTTRLDYCKTCRERLLKILKIG